MFGMSSGELILIGLVALIVVGPKDLPGMFRTLGQFTAKARRMAREFTSAMESAADDAGVKDIASGLQKVANPKKMGLDAVKKAVDFDVEPAPKTATLSKDRAETAAKIQKKTAEVNKARMDKEAAAASKPKAKTATTKKAAPKKAAAKKPAAPKKAATKKPAAKKAASKPAAKESGA